MYKAENDPSCYPNSRVLKNIPDLREQSELEKFESIALAQRAREPLPTGKLKYPDYLAIHKHLFRDAYRWAGCIREVRIAKDGNWFCYPENIDGQMKIVFDWLDAENNLRDLEAEEFAKKAAHFI